MIQPPVQLASYDNSWYLPGGSSAWRIAWFFVGGPLVRSSYLPGSVFRIGLLRLFGARIGKGVVIKPGVRIKYPWHLVVGDFCWLGEGCWIDNLTTVRLGNDVCISQEAYLCTGNHDWSDPAFGLMVAPIQLNDASWAGARSMLTPGTVLGYGSIAGAGSVISGIIPDFEIHAGNPAVFIKKRVIRTGDPRTVQTPTEEVR